MKRTNKSASNKQTSQDEGKQQVEQFGQGQRCHPHVLTNEKMAAIGLFFMATASKFNDPLQAIINILGGIHRRNSIEKEDLQLVNLAYNEAQNVITLVRQLREICQPSHGKTEIFDIQLELNAVLEEKSQKLSDKDINVTTECTENLPIFHAIADQLRTVFHALLENVVQTCGEKDTIHLSLSADTEAIVLRIENSSGDWDPIALSQLLAFFDGSNTKEALAISDLAKSHAIIAMHGGTLETKVKNQNFTGFQLNLPIYATSDGFNRIDHR